MTLQFSIQNENSFRTVVNLHGKSKLSSRYLQNVPCKVECDFNCNQNFSGLKITNSALNYVIIDTECIINYSECLEMLDNVGFIITISSLIYIQNNYRKLYYRLKKIFEDPAKTVVLFQNEYHQNCFINPKDDENALDFITRQNYIVSNFYLTHLKFNSTVVFITEKTEVALIQYSNLMKKNNIDPVKTVEIMTMKEYLDNYHHENKSVKELVESLEAALNASRNIDMIDLSKDLRTEIVQEYLSEEILNASLKSGDFVRGVLRVNKFRSRDEATVVLSEGNSTKQLVGQFNEVLIQGTLNRNRAIDGDSVIIAVFPESQWIQQKLEITGSEASAELAYPMRNEDSNGDDTFNVGNKVPVGRIVGIHKRNWRDYVCNFEQNEMNQGRYVLVTPFDRRVPRIRIGISNIETLIGNRFVVRIDGWPVESKYPNGHFVESLGPIGDLETETKTLLIEYRLYNRPFSASQLAELPINTPENPWKMDQNEISTRRDLRNLLIFSIDPIGCQDVDDTLSIRTLPNGNLELGVHIADVTYFVHPHSLLDLEARKRSTSIYMADRRFDMLPHVLSGDLCSLWSDVDRYAVSVTWELTPDIEVVSVDYFRSVIRSKYKLHYELAQDIYDNKVNFKDSLELIPELCKIHMEKNDGLERFHDLKKAITMLTNVASVLKSRRIEGGGLELEGMEVQVKFSDPNRTQLEDLKQKEPLEMHETIAECMIFANHWVAKKCYESYPTRACLRHHPPPRMYNFVELIHCANAKGFAINFSSNLELGKSLDKAIDNNDPETNKILRSLATMAMSNAQYFSTGTLNSEEFYHYGLALPTYTHFTSPIRRYADILVHRILLCAIEGVPESSLLTNSALAEQCNIMNNQHRQAQLVQRASIELFQALFFKNKPDDDSSRYTEGVIVKLRTNGFVVHIPRYGIKGSVFFKKTDPSRVAWLQEKPEKFVNVNMFRVDWVDSNEVEVETESNQQSISKIIFIMRGLTERRQQYELFDRVFLRIDAIESPAHGLSLHLELVGKQETSKKEKIMSKEGDMEVLSKDSLYQNVRQADEDKIKRRKYVEEEEIHPFDIIASLHSNTSLCHLFRQFKSKKLEMEISL